jgi:hypothetical protein
LVRLQLAAITRDGYHRDYEDHCAQYQHIADHIRYDRVRNIVADDIGYRGSLTECDIVGTENIRGATQFRCAPAASAAGRSWWRVVVRQLAWAP